MNEEYQQKINGYKEDIQQNIDQEAVLQTIKNCKKTFVQAEDYPLSYMEFLYAVYSETMVDLARVSVSCFMDFSK